MAARRAGRDDHAVGGPRLTDGFGVGLILVLTLFFFWKLAFTNLILSGLDVFTYFYPYRAYTAQAIRQGHLPLWNPYLFMGVPFLANIQAAVLYPLNWPLLWLSTPRAVGLSMVGHVFLGGLFTYAFARTTLRLGPFGALVTAIAFAFSGFIGAQVEHVNQLSVSAWFPLLLLVFEKARRQRSLIWSVAASAVVAFQILAGHLQAAYISLMGLGLYAVFPVVWGLWSSESSGRNTEPLWERPVRPLLGLRRQRQWREDLLWGPGLSALVVAVGAGLAAVQLAPTYELSRLSVRAGGLPFRQAVSFSLDPRLVLLSLLPTFGEEVFSEYVAYVGVSALLLALLAVLTLRSSPARAFALLLTLTGLFLALGGYNPVYWLLYKLGPGIGLFRAPARWLFLYTFGVACLAGLGADRWAGLWEMKVVTTSVVPQAARAATTNAVRIDSKSSGSLTGRLMRRRLLGLIAVLVVGTVLLSPLLRRPSPRTVAMWLAVGLSTAGLLYVGLRWRGAAHVRLTQLTLRVTLLALLVGELFLAGRHLAYNVPTAPEAFTSLRPALLHLLADGGLHRILSLSDITFDPGDLPEIQQMFQGPLPEEAIYDYVVATKQKEILAPNLPLLYGLQSVDGYDGGVLPLKRYVDLQRLFLPAGKTAPDGRLREVLTEVPTARWLDLFNVKYVIADKVHDVWVDGVYYDLGLTAAVEPGVPVVLNDLASFPTTSLGVVSYLEGAAGFADGMPVAEVVVTDRVGHREAIVLRAGEDTAEGLYDGTHTQHGRARPVRQWRDDPTGSDYLARVRLKATVRPTQIEVRYLADEGRLLLRGLSLVNDPTGTFQPVTVAPEGRLRLVHSGDVKIYENRGRLPRAFVVHRARVLSDDALALQAMEDASFSPSEEVVLSDGEPLSAPSGADKVTVTHYFPEQIVLEVSAAQEGYLVLSDAYYPGWRAWVDGLEAAIRRADLLFRAVRVPAGTHHVVLSYEPWSLRVGAAVSLLTALAAGLTLIGAIEKALRRSCLSQGFWINLQ